ncbi:MAG: Nif3-like dinuclear metal center hexameric protein [Desulfovibrio sp.]|jgi:dinuclear metal center YbgI/SA1388 family protein|nr:Nif3-like dinuclear metal center hexameric protein [Desulfovibrio sp.]
MRLSELFSAIEKTAPLSIAAAWDASGLQVTSRRTTASSLALCLDPTPESIRRALEKNAEAIVSHHPLTLKPSLPNRPDAYYEALRLLFAADVPLYAAHTTLDANPEGPAGWLAEEFKLTNLRVLEPIAPPLRKDALPSGFGLVGDLPCPQSLEEITRTLAKHIDLSTSALCGPSPKAVTRLACCVGSGSSLLENAVNQGAQLFITGDVKYHTALAAEICLLDAGHHGLEEEMTRRLCLGLQEQLAPLTVFFVPSSSPRRPLVFL